MSFLSEIKTGFDDAIKSIYSVDIDTDKILINDTKKEFVGDYTIVLFPYLKTLRESPEVIGEKVGAYLSTHIDIVKSTNVIKGFLNIELSDSFWIKRLHSIQGDDSFARKASNGKKMMVEFASPNTNKPLHLGHIRNILLGWSSAQILEAIGYEVVKVQIVNDRGIAICKSMLAWQKFGNEETPKSTETKGDHFVGKYYVAFEKHFQAEYATWQESGVGQNILKTYSNKDQTAPDFFKSYKNKYFNEYSPLGKEAKEMLLAWEAGEDSTINLWKTMNGWVYEGFDETYSNLGVSFDKLYFESDTYLLGKQIVTDGLKKGIFYQKEDSSVWIDLTDVGLDHKIVLRSDGTSVYMTQDIGTAMMRYQDFKVDGMVYTVADEQDYHFKVLFEIMKKFEEPYAGGMHHLSYGMVDLTTGKMKSREGTVVDADDLMAEVIQEAQDATKERGELDELDEAAKVEIQKRIGLAALKFYILRVNPKRRMTFDPKESLDMQGQTGPYIQNAFVRIKSILRKADELDISTSYSAYNKLEEEEISLMKLIVDYPNKLVEAGENYDPSSLANYCYNLAKDYHRFYHGVRILKADTQEAKSYRLNLSIKVSQILEDAMNLLGMQMPDRM